MTTLANRIHPSHSYTTRGHPVLASMSDGRRLKARLATLVLGLLVGFSFSASQATENRTLLIDDRLDGRTSGAIFGGKLAPEGYYPGVGDGHILYQLAAPVTNGFVEFEFKGLDARAVAAEADNGLFAMYDGRGIEEPIAYFDDFKQNFFRWNVHYRQNRGVIKAVLSCAAPTPGNARAAKAVFAKRDWCVEPDGRSFRFESNQWHRIRIEWVGSQFQILVDGQMVWSVDGIYPYTPQHQRMWLGSAPGYARDGKSKYFNTLPDLVFRHFKLGLLDAQAWSPAKTTEKDPALNHAFQHTEQPSRAPQTQEEEMLNPSSGQAPQAWFAAQDHPTTLVSFPAPWTSVYQVDPRHPHHFINAEGQHLFVMSKTAWAFFGCKDPQGYLERAKAQGINVIRVALEGRPYFKELGIDLWPWGGTRARPDFASFNELYWQEVERRIQMAGKMGLGINLVLYFSLRPPDEAVGVHRPYWQQALNRLGKYANVFLWEIENESLKDPTFQDAAGTFFMDNDPYRRPVGTSDGTTRDAAWPHKKWVSVAINHSCTGSGAAGGRDEKGRHTLDGWYLPVARNTRAHGKPAFCNESGREKRHKNDDGVHRRKQGWLWTTAGCFWNWHSWDGCEGIDDPNYRAPGAEFVASYTKFWAGLPFWTLAPDHQAITVDRTGIIWTALANDAKSLLVVYLCVEVSGEEISGAALRLALSPGEYRLALLQPSDLRVLQEREIVVSGSATAEIQLPSWADDLLVCVSRAERKP